MIETRDFLARIQAHLPDSARPEADEEALLLAAYLEGGLDEADQGRVEAWLAADPAALDLMLACRADLTAGEAQTVAAPESLIARAQGAVRARPKALDAGQGRPWLERLQGWFGAVLQPVGVAAAVLLAVLAGAELAQSSFANLTAVKAAQLESDMGLGGDDLF